MTVEVACEMLVGLVGAAGVLRGLPDAAVEVAFEMLVLGVELLMNSSAVSRQAQLVEKKDDSPAR